MDLTNLRPWIGDPPRAEPPEHPGYELFARERVDMGRLSVVGTLLIPVWWFVLLGAVALLGGRDSYSWDLTFTNVFLAVFVSMIAVPFFHELAHGVAAIACGARPSFGLGAGYAYTTFRDPMGRWPYLAVGLAPLLVLSPLSVWLAVSWDAGAGWVLFFAIVNAAGAVGDLWMALRILRLPREAVFFDLADGFAALVPASTQAVSPPPAQQPARQP